MIHRIHMHNNVAIVISVAFCYNVLETVNDARAMNTQCAIVLLESCWKIWTLQRYIDV